MEIERIESAGPDRRARRIFFRGVESPRTTSAAVVRLCGLEEGQQLEDDLELALQEVEPPAARERALRLLGYRERSVHEVTQRLRNDGYPPLLIQEVTGRLVELGLLDDGRFAVAWCRSRCLAGYGPRRVRNELSQRGVDKEVAEAAVDEVFGESDEIETARRVLRGATLDTQRRRDAALRKLISRGYDFSTALRAIEPPE